MQGIWIIRSGMAFILCFMEIDKIAENVLWAGVGDKNMHLELTLHCPMVTI
jgi:hypothetical protein